MSTYKALVLTAISSPLSVQSLPTDALTPKHGEAIIQILASVVNPNFRKITQGAFPFPLSLPTTLGGAGIGRISAVGADAVSLKPGQLVYLDSTVHPRDNPRSQYLIGSGLCDDPATFVKMKDMWLNGTQAQLARFPLENCYKLDEERLLGGALKYEVRDLSVIAMLVVPFGGLREANVNPGDTVIVAPATGKFGGAAVVVAMAMGANVIAAGRSTAVLDEFAKTYASTGRLRTVALSGDDKADTAALKAACPTGSANCYIDFSPPQSAGSTHITAAINALGTFGTALLMGWIPGTVAISYEAAVFKSLSIKGRFMYDRVHVEQLIKMVESGNLGLKEKAGVDTKGFALEQIEEAMKFAEGNEKWGVTAVLMPQE